MKYLLLTIVLSLFSATISAECADGYLCKDFLGNTYHNQNGMKHITERSQSRAAVLSAIANQPQNSILANVQAFQAAQDPKRKIDLLDVDIEIAKERIAEYNQYIIELGKLHPEIQKLIDISKSE